MLRRMLWMADASWDTIVSTDPESMLKISLGIVRKWRNLMFLIAMHEH